MKAVWPLAFGILFLATRPPRGAPVTLQPPPTPAPIVVHVSGAVQQPGVYELPPGSRAREAVAAAGGFSQSAEREALNLAEPLQDGARLDVPLLPAAGSGSAPNTANTPQPGNPPASSGRINLNTATQAELENLPRIGPAIAQRIIEYRQQYGPFSAIDEIRAVEGIGEGIFAEIKDLITVESP
jgi:competence protein ComEA